MIFETKFGIGEIVIKKVKTGKCVVSESLLKIKSIIFSEGEVHYLCEFPETGFVQSYKEKELIGDPDFDQELGCYPYHENYLFGATTKTFDTTKDLPDNLGVSDLNYLDDDIPF